MSGLPDEVGAGEKLARFVLQSSHIRRQDSTVKADAFIPYPYPDLSVTRHTGISEQRVWEIAQRVAESIPKTLYGRADVEAQDVLDQNLTVQVAAETDNPNHANIIGWPPEKPAQKIRALEIAARARFVALPTG